MIVTAVPKHVLVAMALCLALMRPASAKTLEIFFIDVEGGEATLIVTPSGESLLIDAGYAGRGGRDPARILAAAREAGIDRIDYLLITHFHPDHVGGVPELASLIPIRTFIDYGEPLGTDRMAIGGFRNYEPIRSQRSSPAAKTWRPPASRRSGHRRRQCGRRDPVERRFRAPARRTTPARRSKSSPRTEPRTSGRLASGCSSASSASSTLAI